MEGYNCGNYFIPRIIEKFRKTAQLKSSNTIKNSGGNVSTVINGLARNPNCYDKKKT
jgi:hypothetical protein